LGQIGATKGLFREGLQNDPHLGHGHAQSFHLLRHNGVRTLYVAATRARDLLVVPVMADEPIEGWETPLLRAVPNGRGRPCRSGRPAVPSYEGNRSPGCP